MDQRSTNQTSVVCASHVLNAAPLKPPHVFALQVSANQFPAAIEIRMIPDDIPTSAARFRLIFLSFTPQRLWNT